ncbi:hypothetical protein [Paractinoplanes rishiriensis]|uniref:Bacterial CdiA-CT RNAse A domain-containing protein n=1 Tax=Paractinoplanes rishiriensis TaxID=1050105 RepID=A0A919K3K1_9ACTN|nr:hypothetical protein [Actinoplanes rishiriensis]GIF00126.1 hypothetical protein Ari01nite_75900 [Actinoplanes rishiriensis]
MTGRPRRPHGGGNPPRPTTVAQAQQTTAQVAHAGRASGTASAPPAPSSQTGGAALAAIMDRYERLGDEPPRFNIARNDDAYKAYGAHTIDRHSPDLPLPRDPTSKTIEGRVYADKGWKDAVNRSYRWTDPSTMNREINEYVRQNWETIRGDLALSGFHEGTFDAGHRVGEGYYNKGMWGAGPRQAEYGETSQVVVRVRLVPDSDPPEPFIVSAFPGLL